MPKRIAHTVGLFLLCLNLTASSCGINDAKDDILAAFDRALDRLHAESNNWQSVLLELMSSVDKNLHETVSADLQTLLNRSIASVGVEARCGADFVGKRIELELKRLKDIIDGKTPQISELLPSICNLDPVAIDLGLEPNRRSTLALYGYDISNEHLTVTLWSSTGSTDVSSFLNISSPYQMILNLGKNGVLLSEQSQKLVFAWKGQELSAVPVVQPNIAPCKTRSYDFIPQNVDFFATTLMTPASPDFSPFGYNLDALRIIGVTGRVQIIPIGRQLFAVVNMTANAEEKIFYVPNWGSRRIPPTTISGTQTLYAGSVPAGWSIVETGWPSDVTGFDYKRFQTQSKDDVFDVSTQQFVKKWDFHIDHAGPDVGYTGVQIEFRTLPMMLQEDPSDGHCRPVR